MHVAHARVRVAHRAPHPLPVPAEDCRPSALALAAIRARHIDSVFELGRAILRADLGGAVRHGVRPRVLRPREVHPPVPRPAGARIAAGRVVLIPLLLAHRVRVGQPPVRDWVAASLRPVARGLPDREADLRRPLGVGEGVVLVALPRRRADHPGVLRRDFPRRRAASAGRERGVHQRALGRVAELAGHGARVQLRRHGPVAGVAAEAGVDAGRERGPGLAVHSAKQQTDACIECCGSHAGLRRGRLPVDAAGQLQP